MAEIAIDLNKLMQASYNLFESDSISMEEVLKSVQENFTLMKEKSKISFEEFFARVSLKMLPRSYKSQKSKLVDSETLRKQYEIHKNAVTAINEFLSKNENNKAIVLTPSQLKGLWRMSDIFDNNSEIHNTAKFDYNNWDQICADFKMTKEELEDANHIAFPQEWIKARLVDPNRVVFMNAGRQLYQNLEFFNKIGQLSASGYNGIFVITRPSDYSLKFQYEKEKHNFFPGHSYREVRSNWILQLFKTIYENRLNLTSEMKIVFSQDYNSTLRDLKCKYQCIIGIENYAQEYYTSCVNNRIDEFVAEVHPDENDANYFSMIEFMKDNLKKNHTTTITLSLGELMKSIGYSGKPYNMIRKLTNCKKYRDLFEVEEIQHAQSQIDRIFEISIRKEFANVTIPISQIPAQIFSDLISYKELLNENNAERKRIKYLRLLNNNNNDLIELKNTVIIPKYTYNDIISNYNNIKDKFKKDSKPFLQLWSKLILRVTRHFDCNRCKNKAVEMSSRCTKLQDREENCCDFCYERYGMDSVHRNFKLRIAGRKTLSKKESPMRIIADFIYGPYANLMKIMENRENFEKISEI